MGHYFPTSLHAWLFLIWWQTLWISTNWVCNVLYSHFFKFCLDSQVNYLETTDPFRSWFYDLWNKTSTASDLGLIISHYWEKKLLVLFIHRTQCPVAHGVLQAGWWDQALFLDPVSGTVLSSSLRCFFMQSCTDYQSVEYWGVGVCPQISRFLGITLCYSIQKVQLV